MVLLRNLALTMKTLLSLVALLSAFTAFSQPKYVGQFYGNGIGLTNIPNGAIRSPWTNNLIVNGFVIGDGSQLTNLTYNFITNGNNVGAITVGRTMYTNITGNIVLGNFSGVDKTFNQWAKVIVTNSTSTDFNVTLSAQTVGSTNAFVLGTVGSVVWVSNRSWVQISFDLHPFITNAAALRFTR